jgi:hypothetical protein
VWEHGLIYIYIYNFFYELVSIYIISFVISIYLILLIGVKHYSMDNIIARRAVVGPPLTSRAGRPPVTVIVYDESAPTPPG